MTKADLVALLAPLPDDMPVELRFEYKTGYDEGDIYTGTPETVQVRTWGARGAVITGRWRLAGGW